MTHEMRSPMAEKKRAREGAATSTKGFTKDEIAAMKEYVRERKSQPHASAAEGEREVLAKITEMQGSDRVMAERLHAIIKASAPALSSRTWYGMPAYTKDGHVVCFFQPAQKFKTRYATLGFSDEAKLDDGRMWPVTFALTEMSSADEARITALVKRAIS